MEQYDSGGCKVPKCIHGKSFLDPCNQTNYYECNFGKKIHRQCSKGTHFSINRTCSHYTDISAKEKIWTACGIPENFSRKECRKIWPKKSKKWNITMINEFLKKRETSTFETPPQKKPSFLVPFLVVTFVLLCLLVILILLLKRRNNCKRTKSKINKNGQQTKEDEESIYAEINDNQLTPPFPAIVAHLREINQSLNISRNLSNQKNVHENRGFIQGVDNQEGEYNVLEFAGIHQNAKSSETLPPDGYSSLNFNSEKNPDNQKNVHENRGFIHGVDNQEGEYNVLEFAGIHQNVKSSETLPPDGYSSLNFNSEKNPDNQKNVHENRGFIHGVDNQEGEYNVLEFAGIHQNVKSSETLPPDGYSSLNFNSEKNPDNQKNVHENRGFIHGVDNQEGEYNVLGFAGIHQNVKSSETLPPDGYSSLNFNSEKNPDNQKNVHENRGFIHGVDNQEGEYNVLEFAGIHQNAKSSETLPPDGYSSLNFNSEKNPDNQKNVHENRGFIHGVDNQEGEYNVLEFAGIHQNAKSSETLPPDGYSSLNFNSEKNPDNQKNVHENRGFIHGVDNQEGEYNVLEFAGIHQNVKSSETLPPDGYSSLNFNSEKNPDNQKNVHENRGFIHGVDNQEGEYNVREFAGIHQNGKSSGMLPPDGYSSLNFNSEKNPDNQKNVHENTGFIQGVDNKEGEYNVREFAGIHQNVKSSGMLPPDGYSSLNFNSEKNPDNQKNVHENRGFIHGVDNQEGEYNVLEFAGIHQNVKSSETLPPDGYSSLNINSEKNPDNQKMSMKTEDLSMV